MIISSYKKKEPKALLKQKNREHMFRKSNQTRESLKEILCQASTLLIDFSESKLSS